MRRFVRVYVVHTRSNDELLEAFRTGRVEIHLREARAAGLSVEPVPADRLDRSPTAEERRIDMHRVTGEIETVGGWLAELSKLGVACHHYAVEIPAAARTRAAEEAVERQLLDLVDNPAVIGSFAITADQSWDGDPRTC